MKNAPQGKRLCSPNICTWFDDLHDWMATITGSGSTNKQRTQHNPLLHPSIHPCAHCWNWSAWNKGSHQERGIAAQEKTQPWNTSLGCALPRRGNSHEITWIFWSSSMSYGSIPGNNHTQVVLNHSFCKILLDNTWTTEWRSFLGFV